MPTTLFCPLCGAVNEAESTHCFACQQPLSRPAHPGRFSAPQASPRITRRTMLISLGVLATAAGTGAGIWWLLTPHPSFIYRGHTEDVAGLAWSPDSKRIASGSGDSTVQIWDAADGGHVFTYRGHAGEAVNAVAWSPDGKRIASAANDLTVQVWDAKDGSHVFTYRGPSIESFSAVIWSPNGKRIASATLDSESTVQVWNATDGGYVFIHPGHAAAWSPSSLRIASAGNDGTVQVWDATSGANPYIYRGHVDYRNEYLTHGNVNAVAWSPNGLRIASAGNDGTVQVWDATSGDHVLVYRGQPVVGDDIFGDPGGFPTHVAWSLDGKHIASVGNDLKVWDATNGETISTYSGTAGPLAWSPDGKHLAFAADDHTVQVWDVL